MKIKDEWLQHENINTEEQLEKQLFEILNSLDDKYNINFKEISEDEKVSNIFV
jgi:hypothetical protein